jgi:hypothetical protein
MLRVWSDRVKDIKAFKGVCRLGLGTHEIFENEVGAECGTENNTLLVRRCDCACARYCMSADLNVFNQYSVETRASVTVNSKAPWAQDESKTQEPRDESNTSNDKDENSIDDNYNYYN